MRSVHFAEQCAAPVARAAASVPARLSPTAPACHKPFNWGSGSACLDDQQRHPHVGYAQAAAASGVVGVNCGRLGRGGWQQDQCSQDEQVAGLCRLPLKAAGHSMSRSSASAGIRQCCNEAWQLHAILPCGRMAPHHHQATSPLGQPKATRVMASSNSRIVLAWMATSGL